VGGFIVTEEQPANTINAKKAAREVDRDPFATVQPITCIPPISY
jgi:hypothetical protein